MKYLPLCLLAILLITSCSQQTADHSSETEKPKLTLAELKDPATLKVGITGMMCPDGCAKVIQKEVYALDGIATSTVDFGSKTGVFEYDAAVISEGEIIAAIEEVNKGAYKTEKPETIEDTAKPSPDTEAIEETQETDEASV